MRITTAEKDRTTVEATFAQLVALAQSLDTEQKRAAQEGLSDDELALFDLLFKENISMADRERVKQASKNLLASLQELLRNLQDWTKKIATEAEVEVFIIDTLYRELPTLPSASKRQTRLQQRFSILYASVVRELGTRYQHNWHND